MPWEESGEVDNLQEANLYLKVFLRGFLGYIKTRNKAPIDRKSLDTRLPSPNVTLSWSNWLQNSPNGSSLVINMEKSEGWRVCYEPLLVPSVSNHLDKIPQQIFTGKVNTLPKVLQGFSFHRSVSHYFLAPRICQRTNHLQLEISPIKYPKKTDWFLQLESSQAFRFHSLFWGTNADTFLRETNSFQSCFNPSSCWRSSPVARNIARTLPRQQY